MFRLLAIVVLATVFLGCSSWRAARLYQSGSLALDEGRVEEALDDLERAVVLAPQASAIQNHLGLARVAADEPRAAAAAFQRAVDLDCDNAAAAENLARARARLERGAAISAIATRPPSEPAAASNRGVEP
jgi:tetratricopeptide (TPR) repeat protein